MDSKLKEYATESELRYIAAIEEFGSHGKASKALGVNRASVSKAMKRLKVRAAKQGYAPEHDMTHTAPESHYVKGVSTLYGDEGQIKQQWVKTDIDKQVYQEAIARAIDSACEGIVPLKKTPVAKATVADLATLYTITDFHLGAYCWAVETGDDWDIKIAEKVLVNAISEMAHGSPDSETGIFLQLGDFLHWDGLDAVTPINKNILQAETRYDLLCELAITLSVTVIDILLKKHRSVEVVICEGNHDEAGSVWLRKAIKKLFEKEPRVNVNDTAFPFYAYLHGETLLGFHHGHKVKNKSLPALFAGEPRYRPLWGQATRTYIHTGHYHHTEQDKTEEGGAIVERHNTLAGRDAYATRGGYLSDRRATAVTYHKTKGERSRVIVTPEYEA